MLLPAVAVVLTTWLASWVGSSRVLLVSPIQATGVAVEQSREVCRRASRRNVTAVVLFSVGAGLLGLGRARRPREPRGVLIGLVGGILSPSPASCSALTS